jgi:hypothetical protein
MPEPLVELRDWLPPDLKGVTEDQLPYIGSIVNIRGWYWIPERRELADGTVFYSGSWFGHVLEIDKKIPESELMILMQPKDHHEGNTQ